VGWTQGLDAGGDAQWEGALLGECLVHKNPERFNLSVAGLPKFSWKRAVKRVCLSVCVAYCKAQHFVGLGKWVSCAKTGALILTICMSYDVLLQKEMLFGGRDMTVPHLGSKIPKKTSIWGMNRHFQAQLVKY